MSRIANTLTLKTLPKTVLDFWYLPANKPNWFKKDENFDNSIKEKFMDTYLVGAKGGLNEWKNEAFSSLALIITLDQFPRNLFRGILSNKFDKIKRKVVYFAIKINLT